MVLVKIKSQELIIMVYNLIKRCDYLLRQMVYNQVSKICIYSQFYPNLEPHKVNKVEFWKWSSQIDDKKYDIQMIANLVYLAQDWKPSIIFFNYKDLYKFYVKTCYKAFVGKFLSHKYNMFIMKNVNYYGKVYLYFHTTP